MKNAFIILVLLYATVTIMTGCKKHDAPVTPVIPVIPVGMTATINGVSWVPDIYNSELDSVAVTFDSFDVDLSIGGWDTVSSLILKNELALFIYHYKYKTGVYAIGSAANVGYEIYNTPSSNAISGTITISQITSQNIQGTFSVLLDNGYKVTNGQFNVPRQ